MPRRMYFISPTNVADHRRGGASICSLAYLQAIAAIAPGAVTLVSPCDRGQLPELPSGIDEIVRIPPRGTLAKATSLLGGASIDRLSPFLDRWLPGRDLTNALVFMNSSRGGRFSRTLARRGVLTVTLFHNVEERFMAASVRSPVLGPLMRRVADRNDRDAYAYSAGSIFLTEFDAGLMARRARQLHPGAWVIDDGFFAPQAHDADPGALPVPATRDFIVACHLGVPQNVPGVVRFIERDWSRVAVNERLGGSRLIVAGASPDPDIVAAARRFPRIDLVADPSEAAMRELTARAIACVSTIDSGSGIKVRVAEALRLGRPVIGTAHGFIGYERVDPRVRFMADVGAMHAVMADVAVHPDIAGLCRLARAEFDAKLSFDSGAARLAEMLARLQ